MKESISQIRSDKRKEKEANQPKIEQKDSKKPL